MHTDVSSPHSADRGQSQVEGSKGIVTANQGPSGGPADQWGTRTKDAYLMPPPPTPHRYLAGGKREEGVRGGGTYVADPGGGSWRKDLLDSGGIIPAESSIAELRATDSERSLAG